MNDDQTQQNPVGGGQSADPASGGYVDPNAGNASAAGNSQVPMQPQQDYNPSANVGGGGYVDPNAQMGGQASQGGYVDPNAQMGGQASQGGYVDPNAGASGGQPNPPVPPNPPVAGQPPAGGGLTGIMEQDVNVQDLVTNASTYQQQSQQLFAGKPIPPHPNTVFDEQKFIQLLANSISLTVNEKLRIFDSIPKLSQYQIDELIKIFVEEGQKFEELEKKHSDEISKLEQQHANSAEAVAQRNEEDQRRQREEEETMRLMQQLNQNNAANSGDYSNQNDKAA